MKFYRRLQPISAISFDLDDTLYSNYPVMMATEEHMVKFFSKQLPAQLNQYNHDYWWPFRLQVIANNPLLKHDVSALRLQTYCLGVKALGKSDEFAIKLAQAAMDEFNFHRSNFKVPEKTHEFLNLLSMNYPLVAISNGNVNTKKIGIEQYFTSIYHADLNQQQKPSADMFTLACRDLAISPQQLLHVGDCGHSDIYGAIMAGCQSAWVTQYNVGKPLLILPNIELTCVEELQQLIPPK
ncbi:HAD-IA family hydrolase [Thalassotalea piscium]